MKKIYILFFFIIISKLYGIETIPSENPILSQQIEKNSLDNTKEEITELKEKIIIYESKITLLQEQNNSLRNEVAQLDNCYKTNISFFQWALGIVLTVIIAFITFYAVNIHKDNKKQISDVKDEYGKLYTESLVTFKNENENIINTKFENVAKLLNKEINNFTKSYETKLSNFEYQNLILRYNIEQNKYMKMSLAIDILDIIVNKKCDKYFGTDDLVQYLEYIKKEIEANHKFSMIEYDDIKEVISKIPDDLIDYKTFILDHNNFDK